MNIKLPEEYLAYLKHEECIEGFLSIEPGYFQLWKEKDIEGNNSEYRVNEYIPNMTGFGSNGGGEMLLFDDYGKIFMAPFIGMCQDDLILIANSWADFVKSIKDN